MISAPETPPPPSDEALWQRATQDDEAAFTELLHRYSPRLLGYGRKWSHDDELVKDCVQDVLAELWLARHRLASPESLRAYLLASVRHRIGKLTRRAWRFGGSFDETDGDEFTVTFSVEESWIADEAQRQRVEQLNVLVNRLPQRQREVIYLKFHQNLSQSQIAEVMGIRYQSVSNLLQRTLASLRQEVSAEGLLTVLLAALA